MTKLKRVFIANRGEIARRIALAANQYGIEAVCITTGKELPGFLVEHIDDFISVEEESPALYLDQDQMIAFAKEKNCDAIHPGFGFLSENAEFAKRVVDAGLTWIGPTSEAITAMASKAAARELALAADVPCVPGLQDIDASSDQKPILDFVDQTGLPILLKAALGGGGKGMRVIRDKSELGEAIERASSEALNSFGNSSLIVEKFLERPRHVEVQILGDQNGEVKSIGDRDCSIQRRHQKIIEEAPAPFLHSETRRKMHQAAVALAKKVGYYSAGTVEFLVEDRHNGEEQEFFFLEMNTRLQVEHPVTEEVFKIDLVQWQFRIAEGYSIGELNPVEQAHSIEGRIYAEDPSQDFFPSPGKVHAFAPYQNEGIRWEIGLDPIDEVTGKFDPMIAKVVATGATRNEALNKLQEALDHTVLSGPIHNMELLSAIASDRGFREQIVGTHYIGNELGQLHDKIGKKRKQLSQVSEALLHQLSQSKTSNPYESVTQRVFAKQQPKSFVTRTHSTFSTSTYPISNVTSGSGEIVFGQKSWPFHFASSETPAGTYHSCKINGCGFEVFVANESQAGAKGGADADHVYAPVPGKVIKILVEDCAELKAKETVIILESMKMEFEVKAPRAGEIGEIHVGIGDQVDADHCLITLATDNEAT